jgi:outer membrane protein assembly factor BamB
MVHQVKVGQTPSPVTLGGHWAFVANMSDGTITQIERATGKVVATIAVADPKVLRAQGCAPDSVHAYYSGSWGWRLCDTPYAIGWDGSSLWALDNGDKQLVRVDPSTHKAAERIDLPGMGWSVAFGHGKGWVSGWNDHSLYTVDLQARKLADVVTDLDNGPATLVDGAGAVWVVCVRGVDGIGHLDRIDPATTKVLGRYNIEWFSTAVVTENGAVYVRGSYGGDISRINAATGAVEWTRPGPGFIGRQGIDELGAGPTGIWMSGPTTARIDLVSGQIADRIMTPSSSVAADGNEVWMIQLNGTVAEFKWTGS